MVPKTRRASRFYADRGLLSVWSFTLSYVCIGFLQVLLFVVDADQWFWCVYIVIYIVIGVYIVIFDELASHGGCI